MQYKSKNILQTLKNHHYQLGTAHDTPTVGACDVRVVEKDVVSADLVDVTGEVDDVGDRRLVELLV